MKLRDWLKREGLTQREFAARVGGTQQSIQRYCSGACPRGHTMTRIVSATGGEVTAADFFPPAEATPLAPARPEAAA